MATRFPLQLNSLRFYVNPTGLNIQKGLNFSTLATQGGIKYQVWYETPEILTITGDCAGNTAYKELVFLKQQYEITNKISELFYKTRLYRGFITSLQVDHNTQHLNRYSYSITFQLLQGEKFAVEDFSLTGNEEGAVSKGLKKLEDYINKRLGTANVQSKIDNFYNTVSKL
jgi:hypothetical protein